MQSTPQLEKALELLHKKGDIEPRKENNNYLKVSYKGNGKLISEKWNIKIYTSGSIVCNDLPLLNQIIEGALKEPDKSLKLIQIDDAGVGFPLCGIMVGVCIDDKIFTDIVDVKFFQGFFFKNQDYLTEFARKGAAIVDSIGATPQTHRIEICTGFVNTKLKDLLRSKGFDVRVTEIKGLLQDQLESLFKKHVEKETGYRLTYDPKELKKEEIGRAYYNALNYGKARVPNKIKTGWKSING